MNDDKKPISNILKLKEEEWFNSPEEFQKYIYQPLLIFVQQILVDNMEYFQDLKDEIQDTSHSHMTEMAMKSEVVSYLHDIIYSVNKKRYHRNNRNLLSWW